ncbi:uncharacterized protein si:dkey-52l18.4 [Rhinichthys klamathensis goyatoka]|uniref:uncharacterized protein si:dkey-52l18.4 n=1 Tax=Rhinichthys klamathensis goyatoka TaxID=3034132 RepID=UPI0024B52DC7|nr:uncharacterized protein si:dkey-52l18.4 [Rhinichthys klamathensis goyatoka]
MMKSDYRCSLTFLAFLCMLKACELCFVRASRASKFVPEGSSLELSCEVQHCGVLSWTGGWVFQEWQSTGFTRLTPSERIKLSNYSSTANSTHLLVHIHNINQSDAGPYKCMITWSQKNLTSNGHVTYVNVTAASVDSSGRNLSHRVLLCLSASMCFPLVLGLVWCLTRDHPPPPPVPPRSYTSFAARVKPKKELVYAEVALKNSRRQNDCPKQVPEPTVYSSVHFS